jgi:hypothetical protein
MQRGPINRPLQITRMDGELMPFKVDTLRRYMIIGETDKDCHLDAKTSA